MKDQNPKPSDRVREDENAIVPTGKGEILLYQTEDGRTRVECRFQDETIWLTQAAMAELFQTTIPNINIHLKNIYDEDELTEEATVKDYLIVRSEGARQVERRVKHYNLDAILAVGYRVRSQRGTQFRRWATERLREYLIKGFVLDDERLKNPPAPGLGVPDYFDEMLERIRDIRASERRMYLRVREIFAMAADYEPGRPHVAQHGTDLLEGWRGSQDGRNDCQELPQRPRDRRIEPDRRDVARLRRGPGPTAQAGVHEGLGTAVRRVSTLQPARRAYERGPHQQG